jgi:hypothetical protein
MSRTQLRVVLILVALILVVASVLFGILTYWVGAEGLPASTPEDGEAGQELLAADRMPERAWQPEYPRFHPLQTPFVAGQGGLCQKVRR